jgi:hypothetical protein
MILLYLLITVWDTHIIQEQSAWETGWSRELLVQQWYKNNDTQGHCWNNVIQTFGTVMCSNNYLCSHCCNNVIQQWCLFTLLQQCHRFTLLQPGWWKHRGGQGTGEEIRRSKHLEQQVGLALVTMQGGEMPGW